MMQPKQLIIASADKRKDCMSFLSETFGLKEFTHKDMRSRCGYYFEPKSKKKRYLYGAGILLTLVRFGFLSRQKIKDTWHYKITVKGYNFIDIEQYFRPNTLEQDNNYLKEIF